ncbi:cobalt ABC transporter permease [Aerococcus viridans]|uniref:Cobalt ABC transporter permease n=1 Tax=Aerococcus viridans TaxID=1377 RepID=A0A2N6UDY3_9LACT|nr:energy-coupling factor transporter transmembrane component T [Aerococcus viridans]PMC79766.1 cobalt ABC transporter permease [Aerococcus viridans]
MEERTSSIPSIIFLVFLLTIEISFTYSIWLNLYIVCVVMVYLTFKKRFSIMFFLLAVPFIPAITTFWSVYIQGSGLSDAWLLLTRTYAFVALGVGFMASVDLQDCLLILEQYKLPAIFIYGLLVVIHAVPEIQREIKNMHDASLLRGKRLYPWSTLYYVKVIFLALNWRDRYAEAMCSRGFSENQPRLHYQYWKVSPVSVILSIGLIIFGNILMRLEYFI